MGLLDLYNKGGSNFSKAVGVNPIVNPPTPISRSPLEGGVREQPNGVQGGTGGPLAFGVQVKNPVGQFGNVPLNNLGANDPGTSNPTQSQSEAYKNQFGVPDNIRDLFRKRVIQGIKNGGGYSMSDIQGGGITDQELQSWIQAHRNGTLQTMDFTAADAAALQEYAKDRNASVTGTVNTPGTTIPGDNLTYGLGAAALGQDQKTYDQHPMTGFFSGSSTLFNGGTGDNNTSATPSAPWQPTGVNNGPNPLVGNTTPGGVPYYPGNGLPGGGALANPATEPGSEEAPLANGSSASRLPYLKEGGRLGTGNNANTNTANTNYNYSGFTNVLENSNFRDANDPLVQQFIQRFGPYAQYDPRTHQESPPGAYIVGRGIPTFSGNGADEWAHDPRRIMYFDRNGRPSSTPREDGSFVIEGDNVNGDRIRDMQDVDSRTRQRQTRQRATAIIGAIAGGLFFGPQIMAGIQSMGAGAQSFITALGNGISGLPAWAQSAFQAAKNINQVLGLARMFGINVPGMTGGNVRNPNGGNNMDWLSLLQGAGGAAANNANINDYGDRMNTIRDRQEALNPARGPAMDQLSQLIKDPESYFRSPAYQAMEGKLTEDAARKFNASGNWFSGNAASEITQGLQANRVSNLRSQFQNLSQTAGLFDPSNLNRQEAAGLPWLFNARAQRNNSLAQQLTNNPGLIDQILSMGGRAASWLQRLLAGERVGDPPQEVLDAIGEQSFAGGGGDSLVDYGEVPDFEWGDI